MSLSTWKALYYPVPASKAIGSELEAAQHSLRKWRGLRDLEAHGLTKSEAGICELASPQVELFIDGATCSLCCFDNQFGSGDCAGCVLMVLRGEPCCYSAEDGSPFGRWCIQDDPEPMISLLEQSVERLKGESNAA